MDINEARLHAAAQHMGLQDLLDPAKRVVKGPLHKDLAQNLEALSIMLSEKPYLVTDQPTLADFAVAGLSMYVKFPASPALDMPMGLKGKGVPGLADNPAYKAFFDWRDKLYLDFRKIDESRPPQPAPEGVPQKISID